MAVVFAAFALASVAGASAKPAPAKWTVRQATGAALTASIYVSHGSFGTTTIGNKARCAGIGKAKPGGFHFFKCRVSYPAFASNPGGTVTLWVSASTPTCSSIIALDVCRRPWTKNDIRLCDQDGAVPDPPDKCLYDAASVAVSDGFTMFSCSDVKAFVFRCVPASDSSPVAPKVVRFKFTNGKWATSVATTG